MVVNGAYHRLHNHCIASHVPKCVFDLRDHVLDWRFDNSEKGPTSGEWGLSTVNYSSYHVITT